ncbi:MAG: hypothetical protein H8E33_06250 [Candidatus Cloacimonetes bacterium]|nr:hypothetical protein [Candidatus Cloacimonadota bacterium]
MKKIAKFCLFIHKTRTFYFAAIILVSLLFGESANCQICDIIPTENLPDGSTTSWETAGCEVITSAIEYSHYINVADFGVVGDGTTYNYDAISDIFSDVATNDFSIIYFPAGIYMIEQKLTLPENIVLKGAGSDSTKLKFDLTVNDECICVNVDTVGIEDLYIERIDTDSDVGDNIEFNNAVNCWVRGVESYNPQKYHLSILGTSSYISISGCYFHDAQDYGGGGHGYGISLKNTSNHCKIENNIFEHLRHSVILQHGPNRNVFGYNYSRDTYGTYEVYPGFEIEIPVADICLHGDLTTEHTYTGATYNLFEGNIVDWILVDAVWDYNGPYNTFFRNYADDGTSYDGFQIESNHDGDAITDTAQYQQNIVACDAQPNTETEDSLAVYGFSDFWPDTFLDISDAQSSYYYATQPDFMTSWPFIVNQGNPAKDRWDAGECKTVFVGFDDYESANEIIYGDVNNDDNVTSYDAALTLQYSAGLISDWTENQITAGDVNGDENISSYDAALILQYSAGLIDEFPVEN